VTVEGEAGCDLVGGLIGGNEGYVVGRGSRWWDSEG
jgi:hypothetical protein